MQDTVTGEMIALNTPQEVAQATEANAPVFYVGEVLLIKGGRFRIAAFGKKMMMLEGLPGTNCAEPESGHKVHKPFQKQGAGVVKATAD